MQRNTILIEFVELSIAMQKNLDQYDNTVGLEFDLDLLVAELADRGTCREEFATRGTQVFKTELKFFLVELPCNSSFKLKISCSTKDECNLFYNTINNNFTLPNQ